MSDLYIILGGGADINVMDISGLTPLHLAARLGNESLVRILLDRGANPTLKDMYNFTPFDHAKENSHFSIMKRLEDYSATFNATSKSMQSKSEVKSDLTCLKSDSDGATEDGFCLKSGSSNTTEERSNKPPANGAMENVAIRSKQAEFQARGKRTSVAW